MSDQMVKPGDTVAPPPPRVYHAINAVQALLARDGIAKTSKNTQQGYAFRGIDAIYNALANFLAGEKLVIVPRCMSRSVTERETKAGGALFYVTVEVEFDLISAEDGSKHTARMLGEAMDSGDKATNKAMSAAYKYLALQLFCIPTEADNDADSTTHEVKGKMQAAAARLETPAPAASKPSGAVSTPPKGKKPAKGKGPAEDEHPDLLAGSEVPWRDYAVHFGKNKGILLGQLEQDNMEALLWYCQKWPGFQKGQTPTSEDRALRHALDRANKELAFPPPSDPSPES